MGFFAKRFSAVKIVSAVLALVMLLNAIPNIAGDLLAWAATGDIAVAFDTTLTEGKQPEIRSVSRPFPTDTATLKLDMGATGTSGTLAYHSSKDEQTTMTIDMGTIGVQKVANISLDMMPLSSGPSIVTPSDFFVYSTIGKNNVEPAWVKWDDYKSNPSLNDPTKPQYVYEDTTVTPSRLVFSVPLGTGYSFSAKGRVFHVLWNSQDNLFYFTTTQVREGNIYTFNFTVDGVAPKPLNVLTGLRNDSIKVQPRANTDKVSIAKQEGKEALTMTMSGVGGDLLESEEVGGGDTELEISVDIPRAFYTPGDAFDFVDANPFNIIKPTDTLYLDMTPTEGTFIQVKMTGLTDSTKPSGPTPGIYNVNASLNAQNTITIKDCTVNNGKLILTLAHVPPSTIFNGMKLYFTDTDIFKSPETLYKGTVYSFLKYSIVKNMDLGKFYLKLLPYKTGRRDDLYTLELMKPGNNVEIKSDGSGNPIYFPLNIDPNAPDTDILARFVMNKDVISQQLKYTSSKFPPSLSMPNNFAIYKGSDNGIDKAPKVIPPESDPTADYGTLSFWAKWDIANEDNLNALIAAGGTLDIRYQVNAFLKPDISTTRYPNFSPEEGTVDIHIERAADGKLYATYSGLKVSNNGSNIVSGGSYTQELRSWVDSANFLVPTNVYYADVHFVTEAGDVSASLPSKDFYYPGIYFLNVDRMDKNASGAYVKGASSLIDNMTINGPSGPQVPPPQNLAANLIYPDLANNPTAPTDTRVTLNIPPDKMRDYFANTFDYPDKGVQLNLYLSQSEASIKAFTENKGSMPTTITINQPDTDTSRDLASLTSPDGVKAIELLRADRVIELPYTFSPDNVQRLVSGGAVPVGEEFTILGLDKNRKYYFTANIVVTQNSPALPVPLVDISKASGIVALTTGTNVETPDESEKVPPAPTVGHENVEQSTATVWWSKINPTSGSTEYIEYEIIRLTDKQLDATMLDSRIDFETFFSKAMPEGSNPIGLRTSGPDLEITKDGASFTAADTNLYTYKSDVDPVKLIDNTLLPNKVYFYYVRTVRVLPGTTPQKRIVSTWGATSVTTTPVKSPENLKVETGRNDYDPKTEVFISFDAPIKDVSQLGKAYSLQYQLKADGEDWQEPVTMNPSQLISSTSVKEGFTHFLYKITGLKPATMYTVRVRMIDENGSASMYTNTETFKTDISQADYDNDKKKDDWMNLLQKLLEEILKKPYWQIVDTADAAAFVMRPGMIDSFISQARDGSLILPSGTGPKNVYYLPMSVLMAANEANKGFKITGPAVDIYISPNAINEANPALVALSAHIKRKEISDTMVRITIVSDNRNESVDGADPLSPFVSFDIEALGLTTTAKAWDDKVLQELSQRVAAKLTDKTLQAKITNAIKAQTINEDLVQLIEQLTNSILKEMLSGVAGQLSAITRYTQPITSVDRSIIIAAKNLGDDTSVSGYRFEAGMWTPFDAQEFGSGMAMYVTSPGTYVLAGSKISIPNIEKVQGAGTITGIVAKYGLDDFFGKDGSFNLEDNAQRYQVAGSIARMAGAPKNADSYEWIKSNMGLSVSSRNANRAIQRQEAIYLAMALYESRTGTKISSIKIRNYTQLNNVRSLDASYKKSVQAAYELGFISDREFSPQSSVSVKEIVELFKRMDDKLGLK